MQRVALVGRTKKIVSYSGSESSMPSEGLKGLGFKVEWMKYFKELFIVFGNLAHWLTLCVIGRSMPPLLTRAHEALVSFIWLVARVGIEPTTFCWWGSHATAASPRYIIRYIFTTTKTTWFNNHSAGEQHTPAVRGTRVAVFLVTIREACFEDRAEVLGAFNSLASSVRLNYRTRVQR